MAQDNLAYDVINSLMLGQQFRQNRRRAAYETEDRDIQKELLQHRLREIKLQEKIQARTAALQNLEQQSGMFQNDVPSANLEPLTLDQLQGDRGPGMIATMPETIRPAERRMRPIQIPGIEELGIGGFERRPQTMEQMLQIMALQKQAEESGKVYNVARGGMLATGGGDVITRNPYSAAPTYRSVKVRNPDGSETERVMTAEEAAKLGPIQSAPPVDNTLVPVTTRDASGRETTTYVPRPQARGTTAVREPVPSRNSATDKVGDSAQRALAALDDLSAMIDAGVDAPADQPGAWPWSAAVPGTPNETQQQYSDALAQAQRLLAAAYREAGSDSNAAEEQAAADLGIPRQVKVGSEMKTVGEKWNSARRKIVIPTLKKRLQDSIKKAGGAARNVGASSAVIRDGNLYIDGELIGPASGEKK